MAMLLLVFAVGFLPTSLSTLLAKPLPVIENLPALATPKLCPGERSLDAAMLLILLADLCVTCW